MKFISWNVNGLRACVNKGFKEFFSEIDADILCLQETKLQEGQIDFAPEGYYSYWNYAEKKGYSGTAVFTKREPLNVLYGMGIEEHDKEGRLITLEYEDFYFATVYTPNSQNELQRLDYRMKWEDDFRAYMQKLDEKKPVIFCGDLNVAHKEIDLKNPKTNHHNAGFTDEECESMDKKGYITDDRTIFLTFDDWGHDSAINPLLYVLRKHGVPATFFVLTHNVIYNPNLLRAIAEEGHDIASHTNMHKAMATQNEKGKTVPTMSYEEYYSDVNTSYERLESIVGDLQWPDGRPVLTKFLRPPTLAISAMGTRAILENGFEYIINGSTSTGDYGAPTLESEIKRIRDGLYYRNTLRKGAIFVMHMTSAAKFTANALDVILTANEKKADNDPTKFKVGLLSDYVGLGYSQAKSEKERTREKRRIKWW